MEPKGTVILDCHSYSFILISQLYSGDRAHRRPIITPAYPAICVTHNVTASTQMVITEECQKGAPETLAGYLNKRFLHSLSGADIVNKVMLGTADWTELFAKHDYFHKYKYYLKIIASTGDHCLQIKW